MLNDVTLASSIHKLLLESMLRTRGTTVPFIGGVASTSTTSALHSSFHVHARDYLALLISAKLLTPLSEADQKLLSEDAGLRNQFLEAHIVRYWKKLFFAVPTTDGAAVTQSWSINNLYPTKTHASLSLQNMSTETSGFTKVRF